MVKWKCESSCKQCRELCGNRTMSDKLRGVADRLAKRLNKSPRDFSLDRIRDERNKENNHRYYLAHKKKYQQNYLKRKAAEEERFNAPYKKY